MDEQASAKLLSFFQDFPTRKYRKRELIIRPDSSAAHVFYLKNGFVRQFLVSKEGQEFTTIIYKAGDYFPLFLILSKYEVNNRYFEALSEIQLLSVPKEKFLDFVHKNPELFLEITKSLVNRLNIAMERLEYLTFGHGMAKVASILSSLAKKFGEEQGKELVISVPLTHKDIASLVGLTRETTSVELEKLKKKQIIEYKGQRIVIKDLEKLKDVSLFDHSI